MYCGVRKYPSENMVSFKKVWSEKFVVFSTIKLKGEVNFFVREFLEDFYFPSAFTVVIESFLRTSSSK